MSVVYSMEAEDLSLGMQLFKGTVSRTWRALAWVFMEDAVLKFWPNTEKGQLGHNLSTQTAGFPNTESLQPHMGSWDPQCDLRFFL